MLYMKNNSNVLTTSQRVTGMRNPTHTPLGNILDEITIEVTQVSQDQDQSLSNESNFLVGVEFTTEVIKKGDQTTLITNEPALGGMTIRSNDKANVKVSNYKLGLSGKQANMSRNIVADTTKDVTGMASFRNSKESPVNSSTDIFRSVKGKVSTESVVSTNSGVFGGPGAGQANFQDSQVLDRSAMDETRLIDNN